MINLGLCGWDDICARVEDAQQGLQLLQLRLRDEIHLVEHDYVSKLNLVDQQVRNVALVLLFVTLRVLLLLHSDHQFCQVSALATAQGTLIAISTPVPCASHPFTHTDQ